MASLCKAAPFLLLVGLLLPGGLEICNAFNTAHQYAITRAATLSSSRMLSSIVADYDDAYSPNVEESASTTLSFASEAKISSEVAAVDAGKSLHDFFHLPHAVPLILKGSKNNQVTEVENIDDEL